MTKGSDALGGLLDREQDNWVKLKKSESGIDLVNNNVSVLVHWL